MGLIKFSFDLMDTTFSRMEKSLGDNYASVAYVIICVLSQFLMMAWSKIHTSTLPAVEAQAFRGLFLVMIFYSYSQVKDVSIVVEDRRKDNLRILRNVFASSFNIILYFVFVKIPMSTAVLIQTSSPFIIAGLDRLVHKTTYTKAEKTLSVVSLLGVILIIRPDLFVTIETVNQTEYGYSEGAERIFYVFLFIFFLVVWCISVIIMKNLKGMNAITLNFPFGFCLAIGSCVVMIGNGFVQSLQLGTYIQLFLVMGINSFVNQHTYVRANQLGKPAKVALLFNLNVVFSFLFEIIYLDESQPWFSFVGAVLILGSSICLALSRM